MPRSDEMVVRLELNGNVLKAFQEAAGAIAALDARVEALERGAGMARAAPPAPRGGTQWDRDEENAPQPSAPPFPTPRPQKRLSFPPEMPLFRSGGTFRVEADPLPEDTQVINCGYDAWSNRFWILLESDHFPLVSPEDAVPELVVPMIEEIDPVPNGGKP